MNRIQLFPSVQMCLLTFKITALFPLLKFYNEFYSLLLVCVCSFFESTHGMGIK